MQVSEIDKTKEEFDIIESKRKFRHYLSYWAGQQASLLGSSIVSFAIIWWLTVETQSEMMLGIASLISLGPFVFIAPISGVIADRFNKKALLLTFDALQALVTVTLSILFLTNNVSVAVIFVILGVRGIAQAFHQPVSMAVAPTMVPADKLSRINGLSYLCSGAINIVGPVVAVALLAIPGINIGRILWVDIGTFIIALIPLIIVKIPSIEIKEEEAKLSFVVQFMDGINTLRSIKGMTALLFGAMMINFFGTPLAALLTLFVNKVHSGNEANYALVSGMLQAALVVGGIIMSFLRGLKKPVLFMISSVIFMYVCQGALAFIPTNIDGRFWIMGSILFVYALPIAVIDVVLITSIQLLIPKEKLGRVMAVAMAISPAIRSLGLFLSGVIAEFIGIQLIFIISSIIGIIVLLLIYLFTPMKLMDKEIYRVMNEAKDKEARSSKELIGDLVTEEDLIKELPILTDSQITQSIIPE